MRQTSNGALDAASHVSGTLTSRGDCTLLKGKNKGQQRYRDTARDNAKVHLGAHHGEGGGLGEEGEYVEECTPWVFWAVRAVTAVVAKAPRAAHVFMSAWMPAPPPESEPATANTRGTCNSPKVRDVWHCLDCQCITASCLVPSAAHNIQFRKQPGLRSFFNRIQPLPCVEDHWKLDEATKEECQCPLTT